MISELWVSKLFTDILIVSMINSWNGYFVYPFPIKYEPFQICVWRNLTMLYGFSDIHFMASAFEVIPLINGSVISICL